MVFHLIAPDDVVRAAEELSAFGVEIGEGGVKTHVLQGETLSLSYAGGEFYIRTASRVQIFYALKLLADEFGQTLPADGYVREEKSDFRNLTYMLDCSRNAVPKQETLFELIRHLAALGYDSLGLYMEDTFVVEEYPYFGYLRTPFTGEDIRRTDEYCKRFGIELVPYIQTLAHFNTLTRHYAMERLFDTGDILFVGEEETYRFLEALISTCAKYFTSRSINIGMDEAYMLGRGAYFDKHGARPRFDIMNEHLARVVALCEKYGFRPMMWSDMFFSLAMNGQYGAELPKELAQKIPQNVELIYWDYGSVDERHYAAMMEKHRMFRNPIGFAGGARKWAGYTPDNRFSFASCAAAARACAEKGVKRFIVTGWGDNGAECSAFLTLPALAYCSRIRYGNYEIDGGFRRAFQTLSGMDYDDFMTCDLGNRVTESGDVTETNSANKYLLFNDVLLGTLDTTVPEGVGKLYLSHAEKLGAVRRRAGKWRYLFETQYRLCRLLAIKSDLGIKLRRAYQAGDRAFLAELATALSAAIRRLDGFYEAFRVQWERENRANGFDVQEIRIGALRQRLVSARRKLREYLGGTREEIPELNERLLDHMGHGETFEIDPDQCEWRWRRMTSVNMNE